MSLTINTAPGQRYIELGCGENPHPSCQVHVDVRPGPGIDFTADLEEPLPIGDADFDGVLARYVLEHLNWRRVRSFLKEVCRILKPTGRVCFITANTAAQFDWIKKNPSGWDGKDDFDSFSCILFGDQDYPENAHKNYLDPGIITKLMVEAGFKDVVVHPAGARNTDMVVEATKDEVQAAGRGVPAKIGYTPPPAAPAPPPAAPERKYSRAEMFDKHYFNGGGKVGGYSGPGYRDFEYHEIAAREIMKRRPKSVLEIGCARGHVVKRLQDRGIRANGLDISRHCWLTRACDGIICRDVLDFPWPFKDGEFDLSYSCSFLEHVPQEHVPALLAELKRVCRQHLHGVDFGDKGDGGDKTHVNFAPLAEWKSRFAAAGLADAEVFDKRETERAEFPADAMTGDGKLKLNVGSHMIMYYHGWTNIDVLDMTPFTRMYHYRFQQLDARNGLPFGTAAVELISASHFLEHLPYADGLKFLKEVRRVLKPGGTLRLAVPDAARLMKMYHSGDDLSYYNEVNDGCEAAKTQAAKLYALLHEGHSAIYDCETMACALEEAGLTPVSASFRKSRSPQMLAETLDMFPELSLYAEGTC